MRAKMGLQLGRVSQQARHFIGPDKSRVHPYFHRVTGYLFGQGDNLAQGMRLSGTDIESLPLYA